MLSYQHAYHAGNFADVHKHLLLTRVLAYLNQKPAGWTCYETHAGDGMYDLSSAEALKTGEADAGIKRLLSERVSAGPLPEMMQTYLDIVRAQLEQQRYPGSPGIALGMAREQDAQVLCELHPAAFEALRGWAGTARRHQGARIAVHQRDGFEGVAALSPPAGGRGVVLIDPSYEIKSDYDTIPQWTDTLLQKWRGAVVMQWYPMLAKAGQAEILAGMKAALPAASGIRLTVEWLTTGAAGMRGDRTPGMSGSGMVITNAPWTLADELAGIKDWLNEHLSIVQHIEVLN
ncbi:23S rRNA (adenine(2030)-N(6))-methyltransferase RlmJ [Allohahella marinimesophila]|uniref:Ribosomal RNA large subunit methyltransferase J n=1 Tax=Allohahella marinimesophila TaxID=1054972 RepID=A0ABP7PDP7_9GAMM